MKIFCKNIPNILNPALRKYSFEKQKFYSVDSIQLSRKFQPEISLLQKMRKFFGFRVKLNPKSFSSGNDLPKGPYVASRESVNLSNEYLRTNCLLENEKIIDGFRDGGGGTVFSSFGDVIKAKREVITIDRKLDLYLTNAINYVKTGTHNLSEKEKLKFIYNLVHDISGDFYKGDKNSLKLAKSAFGKEILLGEIFKNECATCRHKALMFKILAEEAGLKTRQLRGIAFDLQGHGCHTWNEVKFNDGRKFLVDVQNSKIVDISSKKFLKNNELVGYCTIDGNPIYY